MIRIERNILEQVQQFIYSGGIFTEDGTCEQDIKTWITLATYASNKRKVRLSKGFTWTSRKEWSRLSFGGYSSKVLKHGHCSEPTSGG